MTSIKEAAQNLETSTMKNISELSEVDVNADLLEETRNTADGEEYKVKYILVDGEKYRVPASVLFSLKSILEKKPDLKKYAVARVGTTKEDTRYTVIPL